MSMVGIVYQNNHDLDQPEIVNLLVTGFFGTLRGWWDSYLTEESKDSIKNAVKKNDEGFPIFDESIGCGILDGVNTLIYTILKYFVGTPSNISSRVSDLLNNLDVLLCLITDGISRCFYFQSDALERLLQALLERKVY